MKRHHLYAVLFSLILSFGLAGCSLPGWQGDTDPVIEEAEPVEEVPQLDISGIFVGTWMEWSESLDRNTGYSYVFYDDGIIFVSREDLAGIVLEGSYKFVGNNTFSITWRLPSSDIQFEPMSWEITSIKTDEVNFLINSQETFTLKRFVPEQPPLAPPPVVEPPSPPQTPSAEIISR